MQAEFTDKINENHTIKEIARTALIVALVCVAMPFITVTADNQTITFSLYNFITKFYKSDIAKAIPETAKSLISVIRIMGLATTITMAFGLAMLFNKNKATKNSDNTIWTFFSSILAVVFVFITYFYVSHVIKTQVDPKATFVMGQGCIAMVVALLVAFMVLLIRRVKKRLAMAALLILVVIPATIAFGILFMNDRQYHFISLMIIIETMIPFFMIFEQRKPEARELVVIAVMAAIAVVGRAAFFMLPHFKPICAIVIITGITLGAEAGFLCGAMTAFVSNFFFGQGPWTPWQMFAFGIIGFLAGVLFKKGWLSKKRLPLCFFGYFCAQVIYGLLLNTWTVLTTNTEKTGALAIYLSGIPVDAVHGVATFFFLWILSKPMIEKLDRVKKKYGMMDP
ncbi:MAG: ECF transporter S component [Bacillota bacterium]|nr:ECF transporter S component [Bacillota bacterium]